MRIVAGIAKNRKLKTRKGHDTRPTLEKIKESLFSIIFPYVENSNFLDLYSGTGNIALEAISRGAKRAIMIEKDPEALKIIIENVNNLGFENKCRAYKNDVFRAIDILGKKNEKFDIIFMDPPYHDEICEKVIKRVLKNELLKEDGIIIAEHFIAEKMPDSIGELNKIDERNYSKKVLTFYSR
ncbi:16S rRNA (guanine(966)-N(2))-methyltransferase RsmD [Hypnocyclicus thermotrophus]|uniref:16S rRNA (Guanine(966)-N(2))-methyltransferase RsmD n=1 Tax=Hypnocyclicus thermotrophus TaxID=1627895 RepID=A0AA46DXF4_9FUSO|nr:16S rRNA (guanine(966)-N(2))-methyltransferase RsmD [Hypnocyclicus thermotrophus]TDT68051.1 16S rRNA (guanine(966)-N(2))-methyltransferase RsmD [Hypnocyclicus thermotrophus]